MAEADLETTLEQAVGRLGGSARVIVDPDGAATTRTRLGGIEVRASLAPRKKRISVQVVAETVGAGDLFLKLYPEGGGSALGKAFGAQDVEIGESRFDDTFMIKASDESLARLWLAGEARKEIVGAYVEESSGFVVELGGGQATVSWSEESASPDRVANAVAAAVSLAGRASGLRQELDSLAEAIGGEVTSSDRLWRPESPMAIVLGEGEGETRIGHESTALESRKPTLYTTLRRVLPEEARSVGVICRPDAQKRAAKLAEGRLAELTLVDKDLAFHYWAGGVFRGTKSGTLDRAVTAALLECMPSAVVLDGKRLTIWLAGFQTRPARIHRALALGRALCGETEEPVARRERRRHAPRPLSDARLTPSREAATLYATLGETFEASSFAPMGDATSETTLAVALDGTWLYASESMATGYDESPYAFLAIEGRAPGSEGLRLAVEEGDLDPLSSFLGFQDIEVGDAGFDGQYVIKANEEGYARLWLGEEVRRSILATRGARGLSAIRLTVDGGRVEVHGVGALRSPRELELVLGAAAALASRNGRVLERCRSLADALGGRIVGDPSAWTAENGVSIVIGQQQEALTVQSFLSRALSKKPRLLTRVSRPRISSRTDRYLVTRRDLKGRWKTILDAKLAEVEGQEPLFRFLFLGGGEDRDALTERLDEGLQRRLALAEPEALVVDADDITCWLPDFVHDVDRLTLVMKIFASLGEGVALSGPSGPYR